MYIKCECIILLLEIKQHFLISIDCDDCVYSIECFLFNMKKHISTEVNDKI